MLAYQRSECLERIKWNSALRTSCYRDTIIVLDCWKYKGISHAQEGRNYRVVALGEGARPKSIIRSNVGEKFGDWLCMKDQYVPPEPPDHAGPLEGGMRIVFCDRPGAEAGLSMNRPSFEAVEAAFELHPATLPAFFMHEGGMLIFPEWCPSSHSGQRMHFVVKITQKSEVGNALISLTYDTTTNWTEALVCGDMMIEDYRSRNKFGLQSDQIMNTVIGAPKMWSNILLLPTVVLHVYAQRARMRRMLTNQEMIEIERQMELNYSIEVELGLNWPQNIDPKRMTGRIYSIVPQNRVMAEFCIWLETYADVLLKQEEQLRGHRALRSHDSQFMELRDTLKLVLSEIKGLHHGFLGLQERCNLQVNLLFSIISQQESILNQSIATSSKRDSISMSTFTFIAALFLPGTFIATLFSMTMFEWQPGDDASASLVARTNGSTRSYVSNKFWVFWACAVPLTLVTMAGWYFWFRYANSKWSKKIQMGPRNGSRVPTGQRVEEYLVGSCTMRPSQSVLYTPTNTLKLVESYRTQK